MILGLKTELKTEEADSETSDVKIIKIQGFSNLSNQSEQCWEPVIIKSSRRILPQTLLKQLPFRLGGSFQEQRQRTRGSLSRLNRRNPSGGGKVDFFNLILVSGWRVC